jgi:membrane-associated protease RseP (regulator of RpoE activity)
VERGVSVHWIPSNERVLALEDDIHDVFAVHEVAARSGGQVVVFTGQFLRSPELVYDQITERFRSRGYVALLRKEAGRDILVAVPAPTAAGRPRTWVNGLLFVLTVLSTLMAGTIQYLNSTYPTLDWAELPRAVVANLAHGVPFTVALLGILGVHEFGHYFVARHYRLDVSLPYFIPFPLNPFTGTLGAVIRIQSPFESRTALFDVGIAGPLAGLAVAVPVVVVGLHHAQLVPQAEALFNTPLLFQWLEHLVTPAAQAGMHADLEASPLLMAGWWGFLITALNLVPISQLDGGHIAYALFGRYNRYVAWSVLAVAALATLLNPGYVVMLVLVVMMGVTHPPALNDLTPVDMPRRILGLATFGLFLTLITLRPFN